MSAFIVNYELIDSILSTRLDINLIHKTCMLKSGFNKLFNNENDFFIYENLENLGKEFLKLNIQSVNDRYNDNINFDYANNYQFKERKCSLIQAIKFLDCLMYQSCEIDNWKENETYKKMEQLKKLLINIYFDTNEEYQEAEWAI